MNAVTTRILLINDGSTDDTLVELDAVRKLYPERVEYVSFTRNFGKEAALCAGLRASVNADAVVIIDADLEHPPSLIPELIHYWLQGYLVVESVRSRRHSVGGTRGWLTRRFYTLLKGLTKMDLERETDFKLLDRAVVADYLNLPERHRFFKALVKWGGYRSKTVSFDTPERKKPQSSWHFFSLLGYGLNSITSFTTLPLQLITYTAVAVFMVSGIFGAITLGRWAFGSSVQGFTTVIVLLALFSSAIMFGIGLLGFYVGKIYDEVKGRPTFVIDHRNSYLHDHNNDTRH